MLRSKYYNILGLSTTASHQEVKKQYRKLVMQYHPDVNASADAQERFIQISEAYDIIINNKIPKDKKSLTPEEKKKDREERMKTARKRFKEQELREKRENEYYFQSLTSGTKWKVFRTITLVGAMLSLFLFLDLILPRHYEKDEVVAYRVNIANGPSGQNLSLVKTRKEKLYWISGLDYHLTSKTRLVNIERTWFFHSPVRLIARAKIERKNYGVHFTFFNASWLLIVLFLIPAATFFYKRMTLNFTFLYHLSYFGISLLIIVFLLTGYRWAHLLTFGFL